MHKILIFHIFTYLFICYLWPKSLSSQNTMWLCFPTSKRTINPFGCGVVVTLFSDCKFRSPWVPWGHKSWRHHRSDDGRFVGPSPFLGFQFIKWPPGPANGAGLSAESTVVRVSRDDPSTHEPNFLFIWDCALCSAPVAPLFWYSICFLIVQKLGHLLIVSLLSLCGFLSF